MFYVYSTLTSTNIFPHYAPGSSKDLPVILKKIVINGGHGIATKQLFTPKGVMTQISDEDMEFLQQDFAFQQHLKSGHITFEKKKVDVEKRADNMTQKDGSSPLTPEDFEESDNSTASNKVYKTKEAKR